MLSCYHPQRSCEGYVFTPVCHSVHRGEYLGRYPPGPGTPPGRYTPRVGTPPGTRYTPRQVDPPRTPVHPPAGTPPLDQVHPPEQVHPSRRLLLRTVRILLECILVNDNFYFGRCFTLVCAPDVNKINNLPLKLRYKYFCRM